MKHITTETITADTEAAGAALIKLLGSYVHYGMQTGHDVGQPIAEIQNMLADLATYASRAVEGLLTPMGSHIEVIFLTEEDVDRLVDEVEAEIAAGEGPQTWFEEDIHRGDR